MEGERSCYRGGQFNGVEIVKLPRWTVYGGRMDILWRRLV